MKRGAPLQARTTRRNPLRRIAAYAIDWCVFALWAGVLFVVVWFGHAGDPAWPENPWLGEALGFALTTLPFGLYFALTEGSRWQATLGKRALGLRVMTVEGERPSRWRSLGRTAVKLLPWEVGHMIVYQVLALPTDRPDPPLWLHAAMLVSVGGAAWFVLSLWSASGRTPYDRVSGTRVERLPPAGPTRT